MRNVIGLSTSYLFAKQWHHRAIRTQNISETVVINFVAFTPSTLMVRIEHISPLSFTAPITLLGLTALSVDIITNFPHYIRCKSARRFSFLQHLWNSLRRFSSINGRAYMPLRETPALGPDKRLIQRLYF
jgi:hypothetical protein